MASALSESSPAPAINNINPLLLASACSGYLKGLNILLSTEDAAAGDEELPFRDLGDAYAVVSGADPAEPSLLLEGVTAEGDTALHAVAANGDGDSFLSSADLIYSKAKHDILFVQNKRGDTPLHLAARAGNNQMVVRLIALAKGIVGGATAIAATSGTTARVKALLEARNELRETVLHEAVRVGSDGMVRLLMEEDPELARFPEKGTSPLYLAISLGNKIIAKTLHGKSGGILSYSGPNGQNALHAAVGTCPGLTKLLLKWNKELTTGSDENGSTPLHFAAGLQVKSSRKMSGSVCRMVLEANPAALYQPDKNGLFPIHVAASSVGACKNVDMFLTKCPGSVGLLDAMGRTFLHVAAEKKVVRAFNLAGRNRSLSRILNIQDKDGNTALHLAVQAGGFQMVCALLRDLHVQLNLTNIKGQTPLDVSLSKMAPGLNHNESSRSCIGRTLKMVGARKGASCEDHKNHQAPGMIKDTTLEESERIKEATQNLSIVSVVIATVTFGATFALPGGYRADDHPNGGTPTRAGRYTFDAFMVANTLSFICSSIATMGFMFSGSSMVDLVSRKVYFLISIYLMRTSISSLTTAFSLGVYLVLAPVALKTTIVICVIATLVVISSEVEVWLRWALTLYTLAKRNGLAQTILIAAWLIVSWVIFVFWPVISIFGWAAIARMNTQRHGAPAPAPAPACNG